MLEEKHAARIENYDDTFIIVPCAIHIFTLNVHCAHVCDFVCVLSEQTSERRFNRDFISLREVYNEILEYHQGDRQPRI